MKLLSHNYMKTKKSSFLFRYGFPTGLLALLLCMMVVTTKVSACGPILPCYNTYVFKLTSHTDQYDRDIDKLLAQAWSDYTHSRVSVADSRALASLSIGDVDTMDHPVLNFARKTNDKSMLSYLRHLAEYMQIAAQSDDPWSYPTEEEMRSNSETLNNLLSQVSKVSASGMLADRYFLLKMRILFRKGDYDQCIALWKSTKTKNNVFYTMAENLYAGALYHSQRVEEAAVIYAALGDAFNARVCIRDQYGSSCMSAVIQTDPNSPVLPFMLEHMMNSLRETTEYVETHAQLMRWMNLSTPIHSDDVCNLLQHNIECYCPDWKEITGTEKIILTNVPGPEAWFSCVSTYYLTSDEIKNISQIIQNQLRNPNVTDKVMWKTAHAYLLLLQHQFAPAWNAIREAVKMKGSPNSLDNARFIQMLISTQHPSLQTMEQCLLSNMPWLNTKAHTVTYDDCGSSSFDKSYFGYSCNTYNPYYEWLRHLVAMHIVPRYHREGDATMELLAWSILCPRNYQYENESSYFYLPSPYSEFADLYMALNDSLQLAFFNHVENPDPKNSPFHRYLINQLPFSSYDYADVISTHYILQGRWAEAIEMAKNIPLDFLDGQNIAPYATQRSYLIAPWEKPVAINWEQTPHHTVNPKIDFCERVLKLNKELQSAKDEDYKHKAFELASLYYHASVAGGCWWLARYGVHNGYKENLPLEDDAFPYLQQSLSLMHKASSSSDTTLRMQSLFAIMGNPAAEVYSWKYNENYDRIFVLNTNSNYRYVPHMLNLYIGAHSDAPSYLTHCDILAQLCRR